VKLYWNFQGSEGVLEKIPCMGEVWIFSGKYFSHRNLTKGKMMSWTLRVKNLHTTEMMPD